MTWLALGRAQFDTLDKRARLDIGVGVTLFEWGKKSGTGREAMGFFNRSGAIYETPKGKSLHPVVELANAVPLDKLKGSEGPEIMRDVLPLDLVYPFIFAHECGHALLDVACIEPEMAEREDVKYTLFCYNEYRADRFAWKAVMGNRKPPYRKGGKKLIREVMAGIKSINKHLGKYGHPNRGDPLPDTWKVKAAPIFHSAVAA